jgi:hypothetical protein
LTEAEALRASIERLESCLERVERQVMPLPLQQWLEKPDSDTWCLAEIADHLVLAQGPYLEAMEMARRHAVEGDGGAELKGTFIGKAIIRAVDPSKVNTPVPGAMIPSKNPQSDVFDRLTKQWRDFIQMAKESEGKNLSKAKFKNPFVPLFKLNLGEGFVLTGVHSERHLLQMEALLAEPDQK